MWSPKGCLRLEKWLAGKMLFLVHFVVYRLYNMRKKAKEQLAREQKRTQASTIIQTYFRMWKAKTLYKQLTDYKGQKETQLIYFGQQVCRLYNIFLSTFSSSSSTVGVPVVWDW